MTTCYDHLVRKKQPFGLTLWNQWSSIAFLSPPPDMFLDTERQSRDTGLPWGLGSPRVTAEGAERQSKGHQEEKRVSLKTAGWVQADVFVNMTIWTHLETAAPHPSWPLMGQVPPGHVLPITLFSFLQSCMKVKSHQRSSQGSLSPSYLRIKLQIYFGTEAHPLGRPLSPPKKVLSQVYELSGFGRESLPPNTPLTLTYHTGWNSTIRVVLLCWKNGKISFKM